MAVARPRRAGDRRRGASTRHSGTTGRARDRAHLRRRRPGPAVGDVREARARSTSASAASSTPSGSGIAEARFYRDVAATRRGAGPARVARRRRRTDRYVMVLEDLVASGCRFPDPGDGDLVDYVDRRSSTSSPRSTPRSGRRPALDDGPLAFVGEVARLAVRGRRPVHRPGASTGSPTEMPPVFSRPGRRCTSTRRPEVAALCGVAPRDARPRGPAPREPLRRRERPGFFDWGMVQPRAGMWDVAYVLCGRSRPSCAEPTRRPGSPVLRRARRPRRRARRGDGSGTSTGCSRSTPGCRRRRRPGSGSAGRAERRPGRHGPGHRGGRGPRRGDTRGVPRGDGQP